MLAWMARSGELWLSRGACHVEGMAEEDSGGSMGRGVRIIPRLVFELFRVIGHSFMSEQ